MNESDRLVRAIGVFHSAVDVFNGDISAAREWMSAPTGGLAGQSPLLLLGTGVGAAAVLDLLGRLEHGVFA